MAAAGGRGGSALTGWDTEAFETEREYAGTRSSLSSLSPPPSPPVPEESTFRDTIPAQQTKPSPTVSADADATRQNRTASSSSSSRHQKDPGYSTVNSHANSSSTIAGAIHRFRNMPPMPREKRNQQFMQDSGTQNAQESTDRTQPGRHFWWEEDRQKRTPGKEAKSGVDRPDSSKQATHNASSTNTSNVIAPTETSELSKSKPLKSETREVHESSFTYTKASRVSSSFSDSGVKGNATKSKRKSIESSPARQSLESEVDDVFRRWASSENGSRKSQRGSNGETKHDNYHEGIDSLDEEIEDVGKLDLGQSQRISCYSERQNKPNSQYHRKSKRKGKKKPESAAAVAEELSNAFRALLANKRNQDEYGLCQTEYDTGNSYYGYQDNWDSGGGNCEDYNRQKILKNVMNSLDVSVKRYRHLVPSSEKSRERKSRKEGKRSYEAEEENCSSDSSLESSEADNYWYRKKSTKWKRPNSNRNEAHDPAIPVEGLEFGVRVSTQMESTLAEMGESKNELSRAAARDSLASLRDAIHEVGLLTPPKSAAEKSPSTINDDNRMIFVRQNWERRGSIKDNEDSGNSEKKGETVNSIGNRNVTVTDGKQSNQRMKWTDLAFASVGENPQQCLPYIQERRKNERDKEEVTEEKEDATEEKEMEATSESGQDVEEETKEDREVPYSETSHFQTSSASVAMASYKPVINFRYPGVEPSQPFRWDSFRSLANIRDRDEPRTNEDRVSLHSGAISNIMRHGGNASASGKPLNAEHRSTIYYDAYQPRYFSNDGKLLDIERENFTLANTESHDPGTQSAGFHGQASIPLSRLQFYGEQNPPFASLHPRREREVTGTYPMADHSKNFRRHVPVRSTKERQQRYSYDNVKSSLHRSNGQRGHMDQLNIAESPIFGSSPATLSSGSDDYTRANHFGDNQAIGTRASSPKWHPDERRHSRVPLGVSDVDNRHAMEGKHSERVYVEKAREFISSSKSLRQQIELEMLSAH